jgi:hypothetical protein
MTDLETREEGTANREKTWAIVRIVLGQAQIMAATVALVLLLSLGMVWPIFVTLGVCVLLVLVSRCLFQKQGAGRSPG